ncbi:MAG: ACT domain-containing protein, partial [Gammaproteobacteria bacterium]|nr:ACT domain-containing protein [Gammaproteobacteria bacterium]
GRALPRRRPAPRRARSALQRAHRGRSPQCRSVNGYSILEVMTPDRAGLLARIGRVFLAFGIKVQNARITTLGERVEDVFFITDANQQPIGDAEMGESLQRAIREALDQGGAAPDAARRALA